MMKTCVLIPARYNSSRYPGKPLVPLLGKPMVIWVCELSAKAVGSSNVYVATDSDEIKRVVELHGFNSIMTSDEHLTGTDRIAEAAKYLDYDIIVNVQGDEPMVNPKDIQNAIKEKYKKPDSVINCFCCINDQSSIQSKNVPKLVTNGDGKLLYISRSEIPGHKDKAKRPKQVKKQVCIYVFNKKQLELFNGYGKKSNLEEIEDIEILRFFELSIDVQMIETMSGSLAVDTPEDVNHVENELRIKL